MITSNNKTIEWDFLTRLQQNSILKLTDIPDSVQHEIKHIKTEPHGLLFVFSVWSISTNLQEVGEPYHTVNKEKITDKCW